MAEPGGKGAGINPQFAHLIFNASTQYFSPFRRPLSIRSAAVLKSPAAFRKASSLLPIVNWVLKACTETMGLGLVTSVAESSDAGAFTECSTGEVDNTETNSSLA
jgi:hypothetical protein